MSLVSNNETTIRILIRKIFLANGQNVTEDLITRVVDKYRYKLGMDHQESFNNMSGFSNETDPDDCGGHLRNLANIYAAEYHPYCAVIVCLLGIVTNSLNIIVLTRKDMAGAPINRILTALAWADMLLMLEYIPFAVYYYIESHEKSLTYKGAVYFLFHNYVTQILHTTSICLTLTLAIWRFLAIRYFDKSAILCSSTRCTIGIFTSFILPLFLCLPQFTVFKVRSLDIEEKNLTYTVYKVDLSDVVNRHKFLLKVCFWFYSIFLKLLPCVILIVISMWLIRTLFRAKKGRQVLKSYDNNMLISNGKDAKKHTKYERRADRTTKMLVAILFLFLLTELPQGLFALVIALKGKELFVTCYQHYGSIMDFCALLNGSINFILYCCMNRMFRITFGHLFRNKILSKWVQPTVSDTPTVTMGSNKTITTTV
ncbi:hypothetical protein ABEB36_007427 [Hypothenemus hampei]|uniref:G-protein coupled receptors family 1 profile domain-containing protein n=1 Tax=Hypothenemus hampei TaxID=57062 RepID=A0ABD1EU33_HYPHA